MPVLAWWRPAEPAQNSHGNACSCTCLFPAWACKSRKFHPKSLFLHPALGYRGLCRLRWPQRAWVWCVQVGRLKMSPAASCRGGSIPPGRVERQCVVSRGTESDSQGLWVASGLGLGAQLRSRPRQAALWQIAASAEQRKVCLSSKKGRKKRNRNNERGISKVRS